MKNVLGALALVALGSFAIPASVNASPAAALAGIEQANPAAEQVGYRFHGRRHWGGWGHRRHYGHGYGYGHGGFSWKKFCYHNPYHWKCERFGY